jgi:cell division protease FtsH
LGGTQVGRNGETVSEKIDPELAEILAWAKAVAASKAAQTLEAGHVVLGALRTVAGCDLLARLLNAGMDVGPIVTPYARALAEGLDEPVLDRSLDIDPDLKKVTDDLWSRHGRLQAEPFLKGALEVLQNGGSIGLYFGPSSGGTIDRAKKVENLKSLLAEIDLLRGDLFKKVIGQDRAIELLCDACFTAGLRAMAVGEHSSATEAHGPRMILTFVGPPGVGKTYLAEILAGHERAKDPKAGFLRLDMSAYAGPQTYEQLVGAAKFYKGATEGILTGFARKYPTGIVLVDEIEKAHPNTVNIFLQVLDAGRLYENNAAEEVDFSGIALVFTTNLGRSLYDSPERVGLFTGPAAIAEAVIEALGKESRKDDDKPGFAPEILSRLAKGSLVLFEHLGGLALERIADLTVSEVSREVEVSLGVRVEVADPLLLTLFVLRFGGNGDARRLTTGLRSFLYGTVRDLLHERRADLLDGEAPLLARLSSIRFVLPDAASVPEAIQTAFAGKGSILVIDDDEWDASAVSGVDMRRVGRREEADQVLRRGEAGVVILDLHIGSGMADKNMAHGLSLLRWLRSRYPRIPVYLFSETPEQRGLSPETLLRVSQEGGAHGILQRGPDGESFARKLREIVASHRRQGLVEAFQRQLKLVEFEVQQGVPVADGSLVLEIGEIRETTALTTLDRNQPAVLEIPAERFSDVAGAEHAKARLAEVVRFLQNPAALHDMALDAPKGILLTGPPGTGKTTLARAVAGEANVPFFALSGSSLFRKWAGESEALLRDLFTSARRLAPSIVFFDEIDSIGGERSSGDGGSQWKAGLLNELLAQMDGFVRGGKPVFVMAATNRPDMLDAALVRPGRFDLQIEVPNPNATARVALFRLHTRGMPVAPGVEFDALAARTGGLSGAEIRQVCQEAGFAAVRKGSKVVLQSNFEEAVTTVRFGLPSERVVLGEESRWSVAVHEAGHTLAQRKLFPDEPIGQVTILPRGKALGFMEPGSTERYRDASRARLTSQVKVLLSGRAAEGLLLGPDRLSAGCSDDLERASAIAIQMTGAWGMDEDGRLTSLPGIRSGLGISGNAPLPFTVQDEAITRAHGWLSAREAEASALLAANRDQLERLARLLSEKETLYAQDLASVLS